jgi:phenylalanyl-tRNA synthetase alpha subunit
MSIEENMELDAIINQAKELIDAAQDAATLDQVRVEFMGKKGKLTDLLKGLGKLSNEERPAAGQKINVAKQQIQQAISATEVTAMARNAFISSLNYILSFLMRLNTVKARYLRCFRISVLSYKKLC